MPSATALPCTGVAPRRAPAQGYPSARLRRAPTDGSSAYGLGMTTPVRARRSALLPSLVLAAALAAAVAIAGWLLLLFVKGTVVLISYALGIALVVVPLLLAHRIVAGHTGSER